jgi:alanyl-tRNA synthetase
VTERLYYRDAYLTGFEATVLERADQDRRVYLDRTAFYPTSGGQPHDTGRLGGAAVVDVVDEGERIAHLLAAPAPDGPLTGEVDWARRFDHMQQHTGQHLLSAVLDDLCGAQTLSVHFGPAMATLDLDVPGLAPEQVAEAETRANVLVTENRPVSVAFEDAGTVQGLRKAPDRTGVLRIITIQDLDRSACGGTHVSATGEIGAILIRRQERVRKSVRLEFLCGLRAVRRARADHALLSLLSAQYSAAAEELPLLAESQRAELKEAATARRALETELDRYRATELYDGAVAAADGVRRVVVRDDRGVERLRGLGQAVAAFPRVLFIGAAANPPGLVVAAAEDSGCDAAAMLRGVLGPAGGRGGGTPRLAQGTLPANALENAVARLSAPPPAGR